MAKISFVVKITFIYFEMNGLEKKNAVQTKREKNETKRCWSKSRNCLRKCFHSFKYVMNHVNTSVNNICLFLLDVNSLYCFVWFLLYYFLHLFSSDCLAALTSLRLYKFFFWIYEFLKNLPQRRVYRNPTYIIWKMFLKGNLRIGRLRECIFRVSGSNLNFFFCVAPTCGAFVSSIYLPVFPKISGYVTDYYVWTE